MQRTLYLIGAGVLLVARHGVRSDAQTVRVGPGFVRTPYASRRLVSQRGLARADPLCELLHARLSSLLSRGSSTAQTNAPR